MKNTLTKNELQKLAVIFDNSTTSPFNLLSLMIEMHTLGIRAQETDNNWTYWHQYVKPQIDQALVVKTYDGSKTPRYSAWLETKLNQFAQEIIQPWFIETFKVVSDKITTAGYDYDEDSCVDFRDYVGAIQDILIDDLLSEETTYLNTFFFFGIEVNEQ